MWPWMQTGGKRPLRPDFLPRGYFARLSYTHQNPVRHGLVAVAKDYPWCSAAWFETETPAAMVKTIYRFKSDQIADDYEVELDE